MPDWRIVPEQTWLAAGAALERRSRRNSGKGRGPATKYLLSGLAKCAACGRSICVGNTKRNQRIVKAYQCQGNRKCGKAACDVTIQQPREEVETALAEFVTTAIVTGEWVEVAVAAMRDRVLAFFAEPAPDTQKQEQKLAQLRAEQANCAKAIAMGGDIPALATAMQSRQARIDQLDAAVQRARNRPSSAEQIIAEVELSARTALTELQVTLPVVHTAEDVDGLRAVYEALFPDGLEFHAAEKRNRRVWRISSILKLGGSNLEGDPNGSVILCGLG